MKALTIIPGKANTASVQDVAEPALQEGSILVRALELGICGTDFELTSGEYGWAPPGSDHLILGHESLGRVEEAPADGKFKKGDLVVGIVRRPDPEPCLACGAGRWDMCRNGKYTERGIKERNGYGSEFWRIEPDYAIPLAAELRDVGVLMEPASVLAKCWDEVKLVGERSPFQPKSVLITGAGPIGLLAALMGAQQGLDVHVLDRVESGAKPELVQKLGGKYHTGAISGIGICPDVIIECTGVASVIVEAMSQLGNYGILCLAGVSSHGQPVSVDIGRINRNMVLDNQVIVGSVNANRKHYEMAGEALKKADRNWLSRLLTRRESIDDWKKVLTRQPDDIKVTVHFAD